MSSARIIAKVGRRVVLAVVAAALLSVLITPKAGATSNQVVFEQKVNQSGAWVKQATVQPGGTVSFMLAYHNQTSHSQRIVLKDNIPARSALRPSSTYLFNPATPKGAQQPNTLTTVGLDSGLLNPADTAFVVFSLTIPAASHFSCGDTQLLSRGSALVMGTATTYTSNARIVVHRDCSAPTAAPVPHYSCGTVTFAVGTNRQVSATSFAYTANGGASFDSTSVNWGDGTGTHPVRTTADDSHTYARDGTYTITVIAHFLVNGHKAASKCYATIKVSTPVATPTPTTTPSTPAPTPLQSTPAVQSAHTTAATPVVATTTKPTTLVNTGAGSTFGVAALVGLLAASIRYTVLRRVRP